MNELMHYLARAISVNNKEKRNRNLFLNFSVPAAAAVDSVFHLREVLSAFRALLVLADNCAVFYFVHLPHLH